MNRNIKAICPKCENWVEVRDDWYPSYKRYNKLWVTSTLRVVCGYNGRKYGIQLMFWGADDSAMEKWVETDDFNEAIMAYRTFRSFLNKIKKMNTLNLQDFLYKNGFQYW